MNKTLLGVSLGGLGVIGVYGYTYVNKLLKKEFEKGYELGKALGKLEGVFEAGAAIAKDLENQSKSKES